MSIVKKLLCRLGAHRFIKMPVKCITTPTRNIIVCASVCSICGYKSDF
ncbi:hypothetical protein GOC60_04705 [Sinorhizobium meliloti]|nr:hypothetical protein [Sinorhizobium meliloti]MDX0347795.1 hypothetical protein [Sinorhizobium meliloti]